MILLKGTLKLWAYQKRQPITKFKIKFFKKGGVLGVKKKIKHLEFQFLKKHTYI